MPATRAPLPQLGGELFLTDGGLETWLICHDGVAAGYQALRAALPWLTVPGGCCGADYRHVAAIATACAGRVGGQDDARGG